MDKNKKNKYFMNGGVCMLKMVYFKMPLRMKKRKKRWIREVYI
jgi:hypothetical protein